VLSPAGGDSVKAKALLDAGHLSAAIAQLNNDVRSHPTDARCRTFLFELLCFAGDYQRATRQLDVLERQSTSAAVGAQVYRHTLAAEEARQRLFTHGLCPHFLFAPPPYIQLHLDAINLLREDQPAAARALLEQSARSQPHLTGQLAGQPFSEWRDSDDLLSPVLEVFVHTNYVWLPFEHIKRLTIPLPKRLRDLLWTPAMLEAHQGPVGEVFLPVLYPGSGEHANDQIKLGRMTEWQVVGEEVTRGLGQHLFVIDGHDQGLLEIRELAFAAHANGR
jgi:type VI secretion system protein ImpE